MLLEEVTANSSSTFISRCSACRQSPGTRYSYALLQVKLTQEDLDTLDEVPTRCRLYPCAAESISNLQLTVISAKHGSSPPRRRQQLCMTGCAPKSPQVSKFTVGGRYHPMVARFSYDSYHKMREEASQHLPSNAVSTKA